jgi:hypothetical protein
MAINNNGRIPAKNTAKPSKTKTETVGVRSKKLLNVKDSLQPEFAAYLAEKKKENPKQYYKFQDLVVNYCDVSAETEKEQKAFLKKLKGKDGDKYAIKLLGQGYGMF